MILKILGEQDIADVNTADAMQETKLVLDPFVLSTQVTVQHGTLTVNIKKL